MTSRNDKKLDVVRNLILVTVCAVMVAGQVTAQTTATSPLAFDAASIKLNTTGASGITLETFPGGRLNVVNNPLSNVIRNAYNSIRPFLLQGGPDWINSDRYDIEAKAEGNPTEAQMMMMLQSLLSDRFRLKVHLETQ